MQALMGAPKIPKTAIEPPMPIADDVALREARKKKVAATQAGSGRQSTFLSGTGDNLGS